MVSALARFLRRQSILRGAAAFLFISSIPLIAPYTHFRTVVLPVINTAEAVKSRTRCQVARISNSGYGYLSYMSIIHATNHGKELLSYHPFLEKQYSIQNQYRKAMTMLIVIAL